MKDHILLLRSEGKSYSQIQKILGCSRSTISYHCNPQGKESNRHRTRKWKENNTLAVKLDTFKHAKLRLKCKTDEFQHRDKDVGVLPHKAENLRFRWQEVYDMLERNPFCYLTGDQINFNDPKAYSFDHIIPVSKGGTNDLSNLGVCTCEANTAKSDLFLDDFLELCKKILIHHGFSVRESRIELVA